MSANTPDDVLADIAAELSAAKMPEDLREKLVAFYDAHGKEASAFRIAVLLCAMEWINEIAPKTGDPDLADRIASIELSFASAIILRRMKRRQGEPMIPARFALVAYDLAGQVAAMPDPDQAMEELYQKVTAA